MIVISDTSVITNLAAINQLQLLSQLYDRIILPEAVYRELVDIDERRGRAEATRLSIKITGVLGILVEAKRKSIIVAVKPLMDKLIATSQFRISSALYSQILDIVDEANISNQPSTS